MDTSLEGCLNVVEAAMAELKQQNARPEPNWIEQITVSFRNDPIFDEVLAYIREFRCADRPQYFTSNYRLF
jgi:hypothetical protein